MTEAQSAAARAYIALRQKILTFGFMPAARLNEVALAYELRISRTPLREALNRLAAEGLLSAGDRGFAAPNLDPVRVRELFEARTEIECSIVRLASKRAEAIALDTLKTFLFESVAQSPDTSVDRLLHLDCRFHESIGELSGNRELLRILRNLNDRIHLIRWIAMEGKRATTQQEHRLILEALCRRDAATAEQLMRDHIMHRHDEILATVKKAYAHVHTVQFAAGP